MMRITNKCLWSLAVLCGLISRADAMLFKADEFILDNGLRCVVVENHKAPIVKHMVWYMSGSVQEAAKRTGSAHLLEHLMFRGTTMFSDGELNAIMNKNGVSSNAFTSYEVTVYHEFSDISRLEAVMALEADRMRNLAFSDKAFLTEQKIVFQERKQVVENNPASPFSERLRLIMFGGTPYSHPITGSNEDIMAITPDDIMAYYRRFYAPNNALLVLVGDIDVETAKPLVEKYYGSLASEEVEAYHPEIVSDKFYQTLQMSLKGVSVPKYSLNYLLPPHQELGQQMYALEVLSDYLGHDENSAVYKDLVVEREVAAHAGAAYNYTTRGNTLFVATMLPSADNQNSPEENLRLLRQTIKKAVDELDAEKLEKTKQKMLSGLVYVKDNPEDEAYWVGYALSVGFTLEEAQKYEERVKQVTVEDVRAAYETLQSASCVDGVLLPMDEANKEGVDE